MEDDLKFGKRRSLPPKRKGYTQEVLLGGHKIIIRTGEHTDGTLGEIFIEMHGVGTTVRSLVDGFSIAINLGLQHGVPLESYIKEFTFTRFEPSGPVTDHPRIGYATSILDYVFRDLGIHYLKMDELAHTDPIESEARVAPSPGLRVVSSTSRETDEDEK
jgi:ribonucleoside-diphosphate reductase alpha chain